MKLSKDPLTGEEFTPTRIDQRFSCRENQIKYNNKKQNDERKRLGGYILDLKSNEKILLKILNGKESAEVSKDFLLGAGFNFSSSNGAIQNRGITFQVILSTKIQKLNDEIYGISNY